MNKADLVKKLADKNEYNSEPVTRVSKHLSGNGD